MSVYVRIRNGMEPDASGNGGATEGDIKGSISDIIDVPGVVDLDDGHLLVHEAGTPAMTVVVDQGVGYIPNTAFDENDSDSVRFWEAVVAGTTGSRTLNIGANSSGSTRVDLICLKLDPGASPDQYASNVASLVVVAGTAGAGAPALPDYHLLLAEVTVLNGATEIANAKISDERVQATFADKFLKKRVKSYAPSGAGTTTLDLASAGTHVVTMPAATQTIAVANGVVGQWFVLEINNVTSQGALTLFTTIKWAEGVAPTLTGVNGKKDTFGFRITGSNTYDGYIMGQNI